jgi:signal transduction histidine kinase
VIFAIAKNITHKKKLEADRNALLASLTRINEQLKRLNYTTTHDLRSPVNNLLTGFELIDLSRIQDPDTLEVIKVLQLAGEKLKETLNHYVDLLTEKNAGHPDVEELSFQETLDHVTHSLDSLIHTSNVTINSDFTRAPTVRFNKGYLESVFLNLITNSIKYAKPDSLPDVSILSEKGNGVTRLIFADKGLGFDFEKVKDEIFGLHQKFHHHTDSKGIGLYLVHSHVTSMGGKIAVESRVNEGTTFTITFKG